jgi:hypothetical protein
METNNKRNDEPIVSIQHGKNINIQDQDFKFLDFLKSIDTTERKKLIRSLMRSKDFTPAMIRNELILFESKSILQRRGHHVSVSSGRNHSTLGMCYYNSLTLRSKGYKYVEGYVREKRSGGFIAHSWNADSSGKHIDFTFADPENFDYFGVTVPEALIRKVVKKNKNIAYTILPFLKNF